MEKVELEAVVRKDPVKKVRNRGFIPAVVYGKDFPSIVIEVSEKPLLKLFKGSAGQNVIINLKIQADPKHENLPVITHEIQKDVISDKIIHVDFYHLIMTEKIKTKVRVEIFGESAGVKKDGGILVQNIHEVEVKCLPVNIPDKFEIDISNLKIADSVIASNIKPPEGVEILNPPDEVIVTIAPPAKEEVEAPPAAVAPTPAEGAAVPATNEETPNEKKEEPKEKKEPPVKSA